MILNENFYVERDFNSADPLKEFYASKIIRLDTGEAVLSDVHFDAEAWRPRKPHPPSKLLFHVSLALLFVQTSIIPNQIIILSLISPLLKPMRKGVSGSSIAMIFNNT